MMEIDFQLALGIAEIAKGILHLDLFSITAGKEIVAHGHTILPMNGNGDIFKTHPQPWPQGKTNIFGEVRVSSHKIGKRAFSGCPKLFVSGQGGFEQDRSGRIFVQAVDICAGNFAVIAAILLHIAYVNKGICPLLLNFQYILSGFGRFLILWGICSHCKAR
jgi:hypothetical protein